MGVLWGTDYCSHLSIGRLPIRTDLMIWLKWWATLKTNLQPHIGLLTCHGVDWKFWPKGVSPACSWVGRLNTMTLLPVATVHTLVPNAVTREKWLCPYSEEFGSSFAQWEEIRHVVYLYLYRWKKKMKKSGGYSTYCKYIAWISSFSGLKKPN